MKTSNLLIPDSTLIIQPVEDIIPTEKNIHDFFAYVIKKEEKKGNRGIYIDSNVYKLFREKELGFFKLFKVTIYRFKQKIDHESILKEAEKNNIKKIYSYVEALAIIREVLLQGEVDINDQGVNVYFASSQKYKLCRLRAFRDADGEIGINFNNVDLQFEFTPGNGVCF